MPGQTPKGFHCFFPLRLHPSLSDSSHSGPPLPAEVPRSLHSQKEASAGDPSTSGPGGRWLFQDLRGQRVNPPSLGCSRVYGPGQGKPDGTCWRGGSVKGIRPECLDPYPPTHGTQARSGSTGWKAAQVREMGGNKRHCSFLFVNLTQMLRWPTFDLQCCACCHWTGSGFSYDIYTQHLCSSSLCHRDDWTRSGNLPGLNIMSSGVSILSVCDTKDCNPLCSSLHGILQAQILE